jgi:RHS repeat-associated protein
VDRARRQQRGAAVATGLQYNRARWYDPTTGRWISQDPLGFDAGDSNLYRYVNNQPTVATDPSGFVGLGVANGCIKFSDPIGQEQAGPPLILSWKDFKQVDGKREFDATTAYTSDAKYDYEYKFAAPVKKGDVWIAKGTVWVEKWTSFTVDFDPKKSWVQKGKQTADLLRHENLHLVIEKYIGKKAERNAPLTKVEFTAEGKTRAQAKAAAPTAARNKLREVLDREFFDVWQKISDVAQDEYDKKTDHSQDVKGQVDWLRNWQGYVDEIAIKNGWKK